MTGRKTGGKIVILCEGPTERVAVECFLRPQWKRDGLAGIGLRPIDPLKHDWSKLASWLEYHGSRPDVIAVFTLVDLYGYPRAHDLPGDVSEKVKAVTKDLERRVTDCSAEVREIFHPHLSVHEIEAWILAEGKALCERLGIEVNPDPNAEGLDLDDPPSNRLHRLFKKAKKGSYRKDKPKISADLFRRMHFETVYDTCQYFRQFYDDLCKVGKSALGAVT